MALSIPTTLRIENAIAITGAEALDKTRKNADRIMAIFDALVNGEIQTISKKIYSDYNALISVTGSPGEEAYCLAEDQHFRWSMSLLSWQPD